MGVGLFVLCVIGIFLVDLWLVVILGFVLLVVVFGVFILFVFLLVVGFGRFLL